MTDWLTDADVYFERLDEQLNTTRTISECADDYFERLDDQLAPPRTSLTYKAVARKNVNHISDGVIYIHHFGTGFQELVFANHEAAARFAASSDCAFTPPTPPPS